MKIIRLTKGMVTYVDDEDYEWLSKYKWQYSNGGYAKRTATLSNGEKKGLMMHREILSTPDDMFTDHINGDKLDNRKSNLRFVDKKQNGMNARKTKSICASKYKGVTWYRNKWRAKIGYNRQQITIGIFKLEILAAVAYDEKALEMVGEYARTNFSEQERNDIKEKHVRLELDGKLRGGK